MAKPTPKYILLLDGKPFTKVDKINPQQLSGILKKKIVGFKSILSLEDEDGFQNFFDEDMSDLSPGTYKIMYEVISNADVQIDNQEVFLAHKVNEALASNNPLGALEADTQVQFKYGCITNEEVPVRYLITSVQSVIIVAICIEKNLNLKKKLLNYSAHWYQNSHVSECALKMAETLPLQTILSLTVPKDDQKQQVNSIIFTGCRLSGCLAHLATLSLRASLRKSGLNLKVKTITFGTPFFCSSTLHLDVGDSSSHINICNEADWQFQVMVSLMKAHLLINSNRSTSQLVEYCEKAFKLLETTFNAPLWKEVYFDDIVDDIFNQNSQYCDVGPFGVYAVITTSNIVQYHEGQAATALIMSKDKSGLQKQPWNREFEVDLPFESSDTSFTELKLIPKISDVTIVTTVKYIELSIQGENLEPILRRDEESIKFVDQKLPIICSGIHSLGEETIFTLFSKLPSILRCQITHCTFLPPSSLSVITDFGTSESFQVTSCTDRSDSKTSPLLCVHSALNEKLLETCFVRGMMWKCHKHSSPILKLLTDLEEIAIDKPQLGEIEQRYDKGSFQFGIHQARKQIRDIVIYMAKPLKITVSKVPSSLRRVLCGLGTIVGGVLCSAGAIAALPGFLLMLPSFLMTSEMTLGKLPGGVLAAPGFAILAAGYFLYQSSKYNEEPVHNYIQSLRYLCTLLGGDTTKELQNVESLEKAIVNHYYERSHKKLVECTPKDIDKTFKLISVLFNEEHPSRLYHYSQNKAQLGKRFCLVGRLAEIRQILYNSLVISFVGVHNGGKSTLLNNLYNVNAMASALDRTEEANLYRLNKLENTLEKNELTLDVVDFPGATDEREMIAGMTQLIGGGSTFFVCVFTAGHIAKPEKTIVDIIKKHDKPYIIVINKEEILPELKDPEKKEEFKQRYAEVLQVNPALVLFTSAINPEKLEDFRSLLFNFVRCWVNEMLWPQLALLFLNPSELEKILKDNLHSLNEVAEVAQMCLMSNRPLNMKEYDHNLKKTTRVMQFDAFLKKMSESFVNDYQIPKSPIGCLISGILSNKMIIKNQNQEIIDKLISNLEQLMNDLPPKKEEQNQVLFVFYEMLSNELESVEYEYLLELYQKYKIQVENNDSPRSALVSSTINYSQFMSNLRCRRFFIDILPATNFQPEYIYKDYKSDWNMDERLSHFTQQIKTKKVFFLELTQNMSGDDILKAVAEIPAHKMRGRLMVKINEDTIDANGVLKSVMEFLDGNSVLSSLDNGFTFFNPISDNKDVMRGFGRLLATCLVRIEDNIRMPHNFPTTMFKPILGIPFDYSDLELIYPEVAKGIENLLKIPPNEIENIGLCFAAKENCELLVNGSNMPLTSKNLPIYCELLTKFYLGSRLPYKFFILGIEDVVNRELLSIFSPAMLQVLLSGSSDKISNVDIYSHIQFVGFNDEEKEWMKACITSLSQSQIKLFLCFVTGYSCLPHGGVQALIIKMVKRNSLKDDSFPTSHTCFNMMDIPTYSSKEILCKQIIKAIEWCSTQEYTNF